MTESEGVAQELAEVRQTLLAVFRKITDAFEPLHGKRARPIYGGIFGDSQFYLTTTMCVMNGLHHVTYAVMHGASHVVIAGGGTKQEALAQARLSLGAFDRPQLAIFFGQYKAEREQALAEARRREHESALEIAAARAPSKVKSISRRRKRIFDESDGKCHYCATPLTLDGKWHIEHKMPRALGGGDEPGNLVASCAPCNHEKRDTTDVEFKAKRSKKTDAINGRAAA